MTLRLIVTRAAADFRGKLALGALGIVGVAALAGSASSVSPALVGTAIDAVMTPGAPAREGHGLSGAFADWLHVGGPAAAVGAAVLATLVSVGLTMYSMRLSTTLGARVAAALRVAMLRAALRASAADRERLAPAASRTPRGRPGARGADLVRVTIASTAPGVAEFLVAALANLPQIVFSLAVLGYDLVASGAWLALGGGVAIFVLSRLLSQRAIRRVSAAYASMQHADAALFGRLGETLERSEELRLLGARDAAVDEFAEVAQECADGRSRHAAALASTGQIKSAFTALSPLLVVLVLQSVHGAHGQMPPGVVAKLVLLVPLLMARLDGLDGLRIGFTERRPMLEASARVLSLPASPPRREGARHADPAALRGDVRFDAVSFAFEGSPKPQLDGVTLDIPAGAVVGICGKSGSGKSTLLRLLLRGVDPTAGAITVDGVDVRDLEPDDLPRVFGVLGQHSALLDRSLRENLTLGLDRTPDDTELEEALRVAGLDGQFGTGSERDLDYSFRAAQSNLSGGEIRRLALARMVLRKPPVLLLDEPEAALPSADAEALLRRVKAAASGRTCIVVTHAPHLLDATFNVLLDGGRIVARGTHEELRATCAPYRELLADALRAPDTAPAPGAPAAVAE